MSTQYPITVTPDMSLPIKVENSEENWCTLLLGGVVTPCNPLYCEAKLDYNRSIVKEPCKIVFCYSKENIISALHYSQFHNIPFRIRSGRHDYESTSNIDEGIVIDLSPLNSIFINTQTQTVQIGAGTTLQKLYEHLACIGYTLPAGTCGTTGISGLTSVGGIGMLSRCYGLTCDHLLEVECINAQGETLLVNAQNHKELFWAFKGGLSSNFAIITRLTFRIIPIQSVVYFSFTWSDNYTEHLINCWQQYAPFTDKRLSSTLKLEKQYDQSYLLTMEGLFFGSEYEFRRILAPFINGIPPLYKTLEKTDYLCAMDKILHNCLPPHSFKGISSFNYSLLSLDDIRKLIIQFKAAPSDSYSSLHFTSLLGQISSVPSDATAYPHRNAFYLVSIQGRWGNPGEDEPVIRWANELKIFLDTLGQGAYRGFTDFHMCNWQEQYYGSNYERLQHIKHTYDPHNFFHFPQSIEPKI